MFTCCSWKFHWYCYLNFPLLVKAYEAEAKTATWGHDPQGQSQDQHMHETSSIPFTGCPLSSSSNSGSFPPNVKLSWMVLHHTTSGPVSSLPSQSFLWSLALLCRILLWLGLGVSLLWALQQEPTASVPFGQFFNSVFWSVS